MSEFVRIFPGWNVWAVWQVQDLPFSIEMLGVSRDRQLRIWVEDEVRLNAPGAGVADPLDLKGGQIQILNGEPQGLVEAGRKEQVPGPGMVVDGPAELRFVRFFNRGNLANLPWPHDDSYLLDRYYSQSPSNPATAGPGPGTITERNIVEPATQGLKVAGVLAIVLGVGYIVVSTQTVRRLRG